jgi:hypothetical protein
MENVALDRTTVLQPDADGTNGALDAAADCHVLRKDAALDLCSVTDQEIRGVNAPSIRPKAWAGPLHSMLPTIDMLEPMQEVVPAFVIGGPGPPTSRGGPGRLARNGLVSGARLTCRHGRTRTERERPTQKIVLRTRHRRYRNFPTSRRVAPSHQWQATE